MSLAKRLPVLFPVPLFLLLSMATALALQGCSSVATQQPGNPHGGPDTTLPSTPANLVAAASSPAQVDLTWNTSTDNLGVTGYLIERCVGNGCTVFAQVATTTVASYSDSGRLNNTSYGYRVRATDAAGNLSSYSNVSRVTTPKGSDVAAPTTPGNLAAEASSISQIGLTWTASTDNVAVTGYFVERCQGASCSNFVQIGSGIATSGTSFTDSGLSASTTYRYRVRATDAAGNASQYSATASATTIASADTTAPAAPSNLVANASSSSQIGLTWTASTDNVGVSGYRVERCTGGGCSSFSQIGTTSAANATTFSDSGLTASTSYSYRVRASDAAGNLSPYSNTAFASTPSGGGSSITVSVSPRRGGMTVSRTLTLAATVTNDSPNQGVTWSVTGGGSFTSSTSTTAIFAAPATAGVVTITATSVTDTSKSASATIGVTDLGGVLTYHNDLSRDGANQHEYALTPSNVATSTFGKLFSCHVDGAIYAQPLWISNVGIGGGTHNVILVATMHDSVYAFDADASPCVTYWSEQLLPVGETWGSSNDLASSDIFPDIGILGTPVIDAAAKAIYLVTKSKVTSSGAYQQRLHALNLADGSERANSPVALDSAITYSGTCDGSSTVTFDPKRENQRPGLALINGAVYVAWASHGDNDPYHGWLIGYDKSTLSRTSIWNSTPNKLGTTAYCRGGIWMSGGAPAADSGNNIYLMTGNGVFDANAGGSDYADSYLKLSTALTVLDYFTPHDQSNLDSGDTDVGSGGTALLIDQTAGPIAHLLVGAGKSGTFYVVNRDNMGHFNSSSDSAAVQSWSQNGRSFSTPAFWNNTMFYFGVVFGATQSGQQYTFSPSTGQFTTTPAFSTPTGFGFPGATPSVSSSGTTNGIVWAVDSSKFGTSGGGSTAAAPAVLHAYSASNLATELWNSTQGSGNAAGFAVKFVVPTVANGRVYVGTRGNDTTSGSGSVLGELDVYGLLPN